MSPWAAVAAIIIARETAPVAVTAIRAVAADRAAARRTQAKKEQEQS